MKKLWAILLSLVSVICFACAFTGCEDKQTLEENKRLGEENNQLSEENKKLEDKYGQLVEENEKLEDKYNRLVEENKKLNEENEQLLKENEQPAIEKIKPIKENGNFYYLKNAFNNGWLTVDEVKGIACCYYDSNEQANPYSGLYQKPTEGLSKETEEEIKRAYLEEINGKPDGLSEKIEIRNYYGTYNGNIVIYIWSEYFTCDINVEKALYIGGVVFRDFWQGGILVYHNN